MKIISRELYPSEGEVKLDGRCYHVPQIIAQYNELSIAQALKIDHKLNALKEILAGNVTTTNLNMLDEDWALEERCNEAFNYWQLTGLDLEQRMSTLSGGQKTKIFLAGISIHQPQLVLLDEPSNHLDTSGRELLYDFIRSSSATMIIVSHDRKLLNQLDTVCELSKTGITVYGGNYDFYAEQKQIEINALNQNLKSTQKSLKKAREKERETIERQQKLDDRGKKKQEKAGLPTIMQNSLKNSAERSTAKIKTVHAEKIGGLSEALQKLRSSLSDIDKMKLGLNNSAMHKGKILFNATDINFAYNDKWLWNENLQFQIRSGERIAIWGLNGSGKTTLINIMLGKLEPQRGTIFRAKNRSVYIDQDYSVVNTPINVYEQAQQFNSSGLQEHEIKIRLNRYLFTKEHWDKPCNTLSGGERMRLILCCLTLNSYAPDVIVLDEPTNNLDIQNIEILTTAISEYEGTLIVISHDEYFLKEINVERRIQL